ncbi:helix-turn-helix transcriptional regulator [Dyadobacter crusticola]|uniref:helix-turn-helix transcriptional regulator n=1 Tax=Dyadobacter crusticola TaxID=292407 RepID=UPI00068FD1B5|nr:helix-turn-helix transcriptional regulator [Dyadobacter crusticola]
MIYKIYTPSLHVQQYVSHYHLLHFDLKGSAVDPVKLYYPRPEQCLTFDIIGRVIGENTNTGVTQKRSFSYLSRQQTSAFNLRFESEYMMLKIVFKPGSLYRLLGIPMNELVENYLDAEQVIPADVSAVNEMLLEAADYGGIIQVIERYLTGKIKQVNERLRPRDRIYDLLESARPGHSLEWLADQACLSARQLQRKYIQYVGVSPVVFQRIQRFNYAMNLKEADMANSWLTIALQCGYSDLQHLIKDFKQFSSVTPSALIQEESVSIHKKLHLA